MYGFNSTNGQASPEVSMERPTGRGQWTEHREFASWLDKQGIAYEAASMMDLHRDPSLLEPLQSGDSGWAQRVLV